MGQAQGQLPPRLEVEVAAVVVAEAAVEEGVVQGTATP